MKIADTEVLYNFGDVLVHGPTGVVFAVSKIRVINDEVQYAGILTELFDQADVWRKEEGTFENYTA